ncbi:MAG: M48 family metalloprotease [Cellvibrionaceae bacterium]
MKIKSLVIIALLGSLALQIGCSVNPVTGEQNFNVLGTQQEIALGERQYQPGQQSQGGAYDLDPDLTSYVRDMGLTLASVSDNRALAYDFVVLNNDVPNAWALPGGKIAINRGLLYLLEDESELAAVLAHEIVHAAASHGAQQLSQGILLQAGMEIVQHNTDHASHTALAGLGAALWQARYSREHEFQSDEYGMQYMAFAGYDPQGAVRLQQKLLALAKEKNASGLSTLFASHPPSQARITANQQHALSLPPGKRYKDRFQKATAKIRRDKPAYDLFTKAQQAHAKKNYSSALELVNSAIQKRPQEAHFYLLRGDIYQKRNQKSQALINYNRAIEANPSYFRSWLLRGLLHQEMGKNSFAEKDLERSQSLLPTKAATEALRQLRSNTPQ